MVYSLFILLFTHYGPYLLFFGLKFITFSRLIFHVTFYNKKKVHIFIEQATATTARRDTANTPSEKRK